MPSVTIRDLPEEAHAELRARATRAGQSLQEYLKAQLIEAARRPDVQTLVERIRVRKQSGAGDLSPEQILRYREQDRR